MRIPKATSPALIASAALAVLAGCSSASSQIGSTPIGPAPGSFQSPVLRDPRLSSLLVSHQGIGSRHPVQTPSFFSPDAKRKPLVFVTDVEAAAVNIYLQSKNHKMVGQITNVSGPGGLATDSAGNLYVVNDTSSAGNILVFAPPYSEGPALILDDTGYLPGTVAVSSSGVVAAANFCSLPSCTIGTGGSVTLYAKNSTQPCATVADLTNLPSPYGVTFDDKGNLYVGGYGPAPNYTPTVGEIKGGCQANAITLLSTTNPLAFSTPLHIDKAGRIAIYDSPYNPVTQTIDAYNPPKKGSLGSPVTTTVLRASPGSEFAFLASGRDLYFANIDQSFQGFTGATEEYDYPAGGAAESIIPPSGLNAPFVAVFPALIP